MATLLRVVKTLRNNWKKTVFFTGLAGYGIKWVINKHNDELLRRAYCSEALKLGLEKVTLAQRPIKVVVFLNPAAKTGDARKLFEKNSAPLLYLAGFEVNVVKTEYEGQAKEFVGVLEMKDVDKIVVAGGDGTLNEVITGIMKKKDRNFEKNIPVGIIPLGSTNRFARALLGENLDNVRNIAEATMAVINGHTKMVDVLGIETEDGKSTYALSGLEMGAYRDAEARKKKYWYFGPLKSRWTYLRTAMKQWPPTLKAKISYASQESEAASNSQIPKTVASVPQQQSWSWLHLFYRPKSSVVHTDTDDDSECGDDAMGLETEINTVEFTVTSANLVSDVGKKNCMSIGLGPSSPKRTELITEGWRRINNRSLVFGCDSNEIIETKRFKFSPEIVEGEDIWFNIDGNHFEATPVDIRLLKNRLSFFIQ